LQKTVVIAVCRINDYQVGQRGKNSAGFEAGSPQPVHRTWVVDCAIGYDPCNLRPGVLRREKTGEVTQRKTTDYNLGPIFAPSRHKRQITAAPQRPFLPSENSVSLFVESNSLRMRSRRHRGCHAGMKQPFVDPAQKLNELHRQASKSNRPLQTGRKPRGTPLFAPTATSRLRMVLFLRAGELVYAAQFAVEFLVCLYDAQE
jgi:hypothetical protein